MCVHTHTYVYAHKYIIGIWLMYLRWLASLDVQCGPAGSRPRELVVHVEVQRQSAGEFSLAQGGLSFCFIQLVN